MNGKNVKFLCFECDLIYLYKIENICIKILNIKLNLLNI